MFTKEKLLILFIFLSNFRFCRFLNTSAVSQDDFNSEDGNENSPPTPTQVKHWPSGLLQDLGEISGVSVSTYGFPVIFHRGPRVFNDASFNSTYHFQMVNEGPVDTDTVLMLDRDSGSILDSWGSGMFYLPHGITLDHVNNVWLTDIAMHQVFMFQPPYSRPSIILGERFKPGLGDGHMCMPTSVAVSASGYVFVADGYCNSRILMFSPRGILIDIYTQKEESQKFQIPHSLTLMEKYDVLCVADRENMRIVCIPLPTIGTVEHYEAAVIQEEDMGKVYAVDSYGDYLFAITGPTSPTIPMQGYTIYPPTKKVVNRWNSFAKKMWVPHDVAISKDGRDMYVVSTVPSRILKYTL